MEEYISKYDTFQKKIVYNFNLGSGGIGDCIKFFIHTLNLCIKHNIKLYYLINNIYIEKYVVLKYPQMYIKTTDITCSHNIIENDIPNINTDMYNIVTPGIFYDTYNDDNITLDIQDIFYFSDDVKINSLKILSEPITDYISIHLRLGDMYLETDKSFIQCYTDTRVYNEENIFRFIESICDKNILFFCDNNSYKLKIKNKYNYIIITNIEIGHTSFYNTSDKHTLDAVTEFYLLTNSEKIYSASYSGFSIIASKFKNIQLINI